MIHPQQPQENTTNPQENVLAWRCYRSRPYVNCADATHCPAVVAGEAPEGSGRADFPRATARRSRGSRRAGTREEIEAKLLQARHQLARSSSSAPTDTQPPLVGVKGVPALSRRPHCGARLQPRGRAVRYTQAPDTSSKELDVAEPLHPRPSRGDIIREFATFADADACGRIDERRGAARPRRRAPDGNGHRHGDGPDRW